MTLEHFRDGATPEGLRKLNALVDAVNAIGVPPRGDELIVVDTSPSGSLWRLNVETLLGRIPQPTPSASAIGFFPVLIEKDGGTTLGDATTECDSTYTLRDQITYETLATNAAQVRPRPVGTMICQSGSNGFGVAFYNGTNGVKLWDAGEVEDTVERNCP